MGVASTALDLHADHSEGLIGRLDHVVGVEGAEEAAPREVAGLDRERPALGGHLLAVLDEGEGFAVEAVSLAGGRWAVGEHVPEMGVASSALDLHADHSEGLVGRLDHVVGVEGAEEARPAGSRRELVLALEEGQAAHDADVHAFLLVVEKRAAEGSLRTRLLGDPVLLGGEFRREFLDPITREWCDIVARGGDAAVGFGVGHAGGVSSRRGEVRGRGESEADHGGGRGGEEGDADGRVHREVLQGALRRDAGTASGRARLRGG